MVWLGLVTHVMCVKSMVGRVKDKVSKRCQCLAWQLVELDEDTFTREDVGQELLEGPLHKGTPPCSPQAGPTA